MTELAIPEQGGCHRDRHTRAGPSVPRIVSDGRNEGGTAGAHLSSLVTRGVLFV